MQKPKVETNRKARPGRKKGSVKTGGRKKGTPNKNTPLIKQAFDEENFNIVSEYVRLFRDLPPDRQLDEVKFCMRFMYQKLPEEKQTGTIEIADHRTSPKDFGQARSSDLIGFITQGVNGEKDKIKQSN